MTFALLVLGMIPAANPFRALAAGPSERRSAVWSVALATTLGLVVGSAVVSGPLLDLLGVSGPNARIAAGIALLAVAAKDLLTAPPAPEPALTGRLAGVVPLAFPVLFSPALALLAVAGGAERGVVVTALAAAVALVPIAVLAFADPDGRVRLGAATVGAAGAGIAALVVIDGVYAI